jgi:hypothetical protein
MKAQDLMEELLSIARESARPVLPHLDCLTTVVNLDTRLATVV